MLVYAVEASAEDLYEMLKFNNRPFLSLEACSIIVEICKDNDELEIINPLEMVVDWHEDTPSNIADSIYAEDFNITRGMSEEEIFRAIDNVTLAFKLSSGKILYHIL